MQRTKWLTILLGLLLVMGLALVVSAQDGDADGTPEATEAPDMDVTEEADDDEEDDTDAALEAAAEGTTGLLTAVQGAEFMAGFQGAVPLNADVVAVAFLEGFNTYVFDLNTVTALNLNTTLPQAAPVDVTEDPSMTATPLPAMQGGQVDCGLVRVYKVSSQGSQDIWPNVTCDGNTLSVTAGGDGHYIIYRFSSVDALQNAPETLSTCIGTFEATAEAGALGDSVQLDGNQVCWNFSAITGPTTSGQIVATAAPASDDDDDDDDDDEEATAEATAEATEGA